MPPVRDLYRRRGAPARAVGVGAGPVPADHLGSGMLLQPLGEGVRLAVAQQARRLACLGVDQDGPVVPAAAEREVVRSRDFHDPGLRVGQHHYQAQHAGPAGRQVQPRGQPRPGPPGQGQRDRGQRPRQRRGPPGAPRGQPAGLLGERDSCAVRVPAEEPPHRQPDRHRLAADRRVGQPPLVAAVHPLRELAAPRARRTLRAGPRPDPHPPAGGLGSLHGNPGQVRQEKAQADPIMTA